jgi:long-chain acyl-CoA synthetase
VQVDIELYRHELLLPVKPPIRIPVIDIAPEHPRRTMVFLHGFGGNVSQWYRQLTHFSDINRVVAIGLRGHGTPDLTRGPYSTTQLLEDLDASLAALEVSRPFLLIGHSFGTALAAEYAVAHPDLVEALILVAASGEYRLAWNLRYALKLPTRLLDLVYPLFRSYLKAPPSVLKAMHAESLSKWNGWSLFRDLQVPTLVIRGHGDRVFKPRDSLGVARAIPGAEEVNVGASGHMVMLERHEAVNRAIGRFLGDAGSWRGDRAAASQEASASLLRQRPWLAHYDEGVPHTVAIPEVPLHRFLESSAHRFPKRPALVFAGRTIGYARVERRSNQLAHALAALHEGKGSRVMLLLPNLPQTVIAFFGILKAGATVVFASPLSEPEELLRQIRDSRADVLITLTRLSAVAHQALEVGALRHVILTSVGDYMPRLRGWVFALSRGRGEAVRGRLPPGMFILETLLHAAPQTPFPAVVSSGDLAVIAYTGGTTDVPKGVMLTHRNLVANALQFRHWVPDLKEGKEIYLCVLPFSHSYGLTAALTTPVMMGASMIILPTFITLDVLRAIRRHRPTLFPGVPSMYLAINSIPGARRFGIRSIRACMSGAAPLPVEVQESFEKLTRGRLVEGYGQTETSPVTHANPMYGRRKVGSIGIPIPSTESKVVDLGTGEDLPAGQIGELAVRGPQVMAGYLGLPEATQEVLRPDGWLLTGDIARVDEDGYYQLIARKRDMILAGAYQVYPRDVEEVLYEHPKVKEVAVIGVQRPTSPGQVVKAFVVLREGEHVSQEELITLCRRRLAEYAVPWEIEFRSELPHSFVGKVLRRLLTEQDLAARD